MPRRPKPPLERIARALCRNAGNPENITYHGRPMWESYLPEARAVVEALLDGASEGERAVVEGWLG